jgi:hypothetical protein
MPRPQTYLVVLAREAVVVPGRAVGFDDQPLRRPAKVRHHPPARQDQATLTFVPARGTFSTNDVRLGGHVPMMATRASRHSTRT